MEEARATATEELATQKKKLSSMEKENKQLQTEKDELTQLKATSASTSEEVSSLKKKLNALEHGLTFFCAKITSARQKETERRNGGSTNYCKRRSCYTEEKAIGYGKRK